MGRLFAYVLSAAILTHQASAAPPPPSQVPDRFAVRMDGFDIASMFRHWSFFAQFRTVAAVEQAIDLRTEQLDKDDTFILSVINISEGRYANSMMFWQECKDGDCNYVAQRYSIPSATLDTVLADLFKPEAAVASLKAEGIKPGDTYDYDLDQEDSKAAILKALEVERITGDECPVLSRNLEAVEGMTLPALDLKKVGSDQQGRANIAHGRNTRVTVPVYLKEGHSHGSYTLEGWGGGSLATDIALKVEDQLDDCPWETVSQG